MTNLKLAVRTILKAPFVTLIAVISLALGIGANSAIFSLFDQMLLRPLPVPEPERLVNLAAPGPNPGSQSCNQAGDCQTVWSYPMLRDLQREQTVFTGIAAHRAFGANLAFRGETLNGQGVLVSGSYFPVLGVQPALGRLLGPDDDRTPGGDALVVLSHLYWRTRFDQRPDIVGEPLIVNGHAMTIVGVAPEGFKGTTLGSDPQVFVPITMSAEMMPWWGDFEKVQNRRAYWIYLFARLRPGVSIEQARTAINVPYHAIINDVEAPLQTNMSDQTMARFRAKEVVVEDGRRGQSNIHREARAPLWVLFAVTGVVLLIACANVANLLLARAATRANEMAVRLSIGASRGRLIRQLLVESCLLAGLGGLAGLVVAHWTLGLIRTLVPPEAIRSVSFELDPTAVFFAAALSLATGILFGLFPALHSTRPNLVTTLKAQAGQTSGTRAAAAFRTSLATAQIALSMALLISAGLFAKSLYNVSRIDLGLKVENLVTFGLSPMLNSYKSEQSRVLFERIEDELAAIPGVTGVTSAMVALVAGNSWGNDVSVEGFESGPDTDANSRYNEVGPDYFRTLGIPLQAGREFTRADTLADPKVAIVNEAFARKFNLGHDAVGRRMAQGRNKELDIEIVGLAPDTKYNEVKDAVPPLFVRPYRQDDELGFLTFYVRTALPPEQLLPVVTSTIKRLDPNLPVEDLKTMEMQVRENVFVDRMISTLSVAFAVLATILAAVGLYGVLAYMVTRRTREIGLRMALGADRGRVQRLVLRQVGWMTIIGGVVGIGAALGLGRVARSLLYEIQGHDPVVLIVSVVLLALIAVGAGFIPALRASRIDPMLALRYE